MGLTRQWGESNGLAPVIYLSQLAPVTSALSSLFGSNLGSAENVNTIISCIKPVEGSMVVGNEPITKEFYQENEWRYVPKSPQIRQWVSKEEHSNPHILSQINETAKQFGGLQISPNDIKYIFVKSDSDIPSIIDFIQTELGSFSGNDLKVLMSRVVSLDNINVDL